MVDILGVTKSYAEGTTSHLVLDHLDLHIRQGEIVILVGKSGSGKSTLLNILSGIDVPDAGRVLISGVEIHALSETERTLLRRKRIGFVFQSFNLLPTLTVAENLRLPLELNGLTNADHRVREMLESVGLADRAAAFPDRLSGGEQQRVAIARALVHDPDIVLADEPTGNLDDVSSLRIVDLLDAVVKRAGKTMIMVTHSRDVVGLADRVLALKHGRIEEVEWSEQRA